MDAVEPPLGTVRLFADYAESVIWFPGMVDYVESALSPELIRDLEEWKGKQLSDPDSEVEGFGLAWRLADELGGEFEVDFQVDGRADRSIRSQSPASNTAAREAFLGFVAQEREDEVLQARSRESASPAEWYPVTSEPKKRRWFGRFRG
jgi:hypothetical protein